MGLDVAHECLGGGEGQLEGRALEVVHEDERVLRVDARMLGRRPEEIVRMRGQVLVHGRAGGDEDGHRSAAPPARPARLLPHRGDRAGIAGEDGRVEVTDVDAELERARGHHPQHLARAQPLLDLPPAQRQVAAAVAANDARVARPVLDSLLHGREHHLGGEAALAEDDGGDPLLEKADGEPRRLPEIRRANPQLGIDHGRVVAEKELLPRGRSALPDLADVLARQTLRELARIGDGGRGHDELRGRAVVAADAREPSQHVGEVAAEDAAIRVQLVDHDVAEILEEVHPLGVVRQDAGVEHVGIGEHEVGPRAHRAAGVLRSVTVVRVHAHVGQRLRELRQLGELILGEGLGGEQIQHARLRLLHEGLEHGQVVAERLAGCGRRHHDHVLALGDGLEGPRLVRVELLDPAPAECLDEARVERGGKRRVDGGAGLEVPDGGDERAGPGRCQQLVENILERHGSSYV